MKKKSPYGFLLPLGSAFLALAIVLYFFHPLAPLVLLASLLVQIPIIVIVTRVNMGKGYVERSAERRLQYEKDGDATTFLAAEEREAGGAGFAYWSPRGKSLSSLNRAVLLCELGRGAEAAQRLAEVNEKALDSEDQKRFATVVQALRGGAGQ